jgi:hypothetical protein
MKVHNDVANVMESEMVHAEVSQPATDTELDKTREDSSKSGQEYLGESAEISVGPGQMIHTEVSKMATNTVNWKGEDSVSVVEASGINMDPLMKLADVYMVPGWDYGEVKRDDTLVNESQKKKLISKKVGLGRTSLMTCRRT